MKVQEFANNDYWSRTLFLFALDVMVLKKLITIVFGAGRSEVAVIEDSLTRNKPS